MSKRSLRFLVFRTHAILKKKNVFRTQTGEESLKESLLSVITASDNVTLEVLNEAFCRDAEAFSEAFQVD